MSFMWTIIIAWLAVQIPLGMLIGKCIQFGTDDAPNTSNRKRAAEVGAEQGRRNRRENANGPGAPFGWYQGRRRSAANTPRKGIATDA
jgi:hypothetical protein